jgi:outer membrane receptor protein involved in Fe transport
MGMAPANAQEEQMVEEVVVTGSRIQRANLVSASPVTQLDNEQLRLTGLTRVEDALASIPAISLDQSAGQSIEATGTATLQLRNLGAKRTLVLMNGRRLPASTPSGGVDASAGDVNLIPGQLIQRVEVLTGGASSTYGADAVAGVVNFIMMDDFEGLKIDYQYSGYRHDTDEGSVARRVRTSALEKGLDAPSGVQTDGNISDFTMIMGGNFDNGRGNLTAFGTYREVEGVVQGSRATSVCAFNLTSGCGGSTTNASGGILPLDSAGLGITHTVDGNSFIPEAAALFNFAAPSFFQRPDERVVVGTFGHYDVNEHVEVYTELMFMDTKSTAQFGPAGIFGAAVTVNCDNPLISAQQLAILGCANGETTEFSLRRRNVEGGPRFGATRHTTYRGVFGARGDINDSWRYDVSWQYSEVNMNNRNGNYFDTNRLEQALNAVLDDSGNVVCAPGADDGCVPYNLFQTGGVTDEATGFLSQEYYQTGVTSQEVFNAYVQGSLGDYGIASPFAESGIEVVGGVEYRDELLRNDYSDNAKRGTVGGAGAASVPTFGRYDVYDVYFEASVPLVEDVTMIQALVLDLGYRYSDYSFGPTTDTYKFAGSWTVNDDVRARASFQRAVRAPNVIELFEPLGGGLFAMQNDPCNKANPGDALSRSGYTFEQCARSGVSQAIWDQGGPLNNPANQYNQLAGGNLELEPEEADTLSFGVVWTPDFIDGLTVSIDYYDIEITGAIQSPDEEITLIGCVANGTNCDRINRGINDTLWLGLATPENSVAAPYDNIGLLATQGYDIEINYTFDVGDMGTVNIANITGVVDSYEQEDFPGAGIVDCEGSYGSTCGLPVIDFKNRMQATWATPWNVTANLIWRHIGEVDEIGNPGTPNDIKAMDYFDLSATWDVTEWGQLRVGINNLLDEEPPLVQNGATARENGNTYPGIYDALGQYMFAGFTVQF